MSLLPLDPRIDAYDEAGRVAELALLGRLDSSFRFIEPQAAWAASGRLSLRARPEAGSPQVTQALLGEAMQVLLRRPDGWAWCRTLHDGYLGYARADQLVAQAPATPLGITALRAHALAGPSVKAEVLEELSLGASLQRAGEAVQEQGHRWLPVTLPGGRSAWVQEVCAAPLPDADPLTLARRLLGTPYVWGGRSAWGLDCSGLTQLVLGAFGTPLPRDADQQQAAVTPVTSPQAGDLAFFPGHVGLMLSERHLLHANATRMAVSTETLGEGEYGAALHRSLVGFGRA